MHMKDLIITLHFLHPYDSDKLIEILNQINYDDDIDVIIIDSLTHFWTKEGGILDRKAERIVIILNQILTLTGLNLQVNLIK